LDIITKIPNMDYREDPPSIDVEEFRKVIQSRRSVRVFDGTSIPPEVVVDCIDMAMLAPSSSNLQPWEFYWIRTPEKKAKVVEYCLSQPAARTAAELIVCVARTDTWRKHSHEMLRVFKRQKEEVPKSVVIYYSTLAPVMYTHGLLNFWGLTKKVIFFLRGLTQPTPREPTSPADMLVWAVKSASLAAENLMLAFRAHGYDTCPMEGFDSYRMKKLLNLPAAANIIMVVGAGKRAKNGVYGPQIRFDRSWFVKTV